MVPVLEARLVLIGRLVQERGLGVLGLLSVKGTCCPISVGRGRIVLGHRYANQLDLFFICLAEFDVLHEGVENGLSFSRVHLFEIGLV